MCGVSARGVLVKQHAAKTHNTHLRGTGPPLPSGGYAAPRTCRMAPGMGAALAAGPPPPRGGGAVSRRNADAKMPSPPYLGNEGVSGSVGGVGSFWTTHV